MRYTELLKLASSLKDKSTKSPLDYIAWLPMQLAFLKHDKKDQPFLFRAGNRQGKTTVGAAEVLFRARGYHPYKKVKAAPVNIAVVCFSLQQSVPIQEMIWQLMDKAQAEEGTFFNTKTGFGGHKPVLKFKNGSAIHFYGNAQGAGALAGSEYDFILLDEPPYQEVYDECLKRVLNTGGQVALTLTPINGPPLPWLKDYCEKDIIKDYHQKLTPESQISPITGRIRKTKDGQEWDSDFIERERKRTNAIDGPIRLDGEWQSKVTGQFFATFDKAKHILSKAPDVEMKLCLGIDYAAADREKGLCAVLSGYYLEQDIPTIYVIDEVAIAGHKTMEDFAHAILKMLNKAGFKWRDLDFVWGDNAVSSSTTLSSNVELFKALHKVLSLKQGSLMPKIRNVKEGSGASNKRRRTKDIRSRWLYGEISNDRFTISKDATWCCEALEMWDYDDSSIYKDVLDAMMYGLRSLWAQEGIAHGKIKQVRIA